MSLPQTSLLRASQRAMRQMADRNTPFIKDEWYVVAFVTEIGRALLERTIIGQRLVLFLSPVGRKTGRRHRHLWLSRHAF